MKRKWTFFWLITSVFVLSLIFLNIDAFKRYDIEQVSYFEFFKINGVMFAIYGVVISSFWSLSNSLENSRTLNQRTEFDKNSNSMKFFEKWDDSLLVEARDFTRELREERKDISDNELLKRIDESPKSDKHKNLKRSLVVCFNFYELMNVAIKNGMVNESLLRNSFKFIFIDMFDRFKPWLEDEKHCNKDSKKELDELYKRWNK
ncbi:hypothetical protein C900_01445 [Fulvivirga imtechensis AK7]|uniref:DUF4760 domain-containing protein n=2 Tax=Fulvivirga TaxID=396811 RepID=L8JYH8_9BACT|nr:hypothetical protein C900_01445 [Fulvivirga imtechensis AK7]